MNELMIVFSQTGVNDLQNNHRKTNKIQKKKWTLSASYESFKDYQCLFIIQIRLELDNKFIWYILNL